MDKSDYTRIRNLIHRLKRDNRQITIDDYGAGSKKLSNERTINSILRTSASNDKFGRILYSVSKSIKPEHILELGTSIGIGASYMKLGSKNANITTIEACSNTAKIANENFEELEIEVNLVNNTFDAYLEQIQRSNTKYNLIYIDGHHDGVALLKYIYTLKKHMAENAVIIIDDIRWSDSMKNAWDTLVNSNDYSICIDLFRMGILTINNEDKHPLFTI